MAAMFLDMARRLADLRTPARAGFNNVFEVNFGLTRTPRTAPRPTCGAWVGYTRYSYTPIRITNERLHLGQPSSPQSGVRLRSAEPSSRRRSSASLKMMAKDQNCTYSFSSECLS